MPQSRINHTVASPHSPITAGTAQQTPAHASSQSTSAQLVPNITHHVIIPDPPVNPNPTSVHPMVTRFRDEYDALIKNSTWTLVPRSPDANVVGCSLHYLTFTSPNISYVVQKVCLYMHDPREPHFSALKRILRYVRGTLHYGLQLLSSSTTDLVAYSDVDWAGCPTTRRSTSEAEYRDVANVVVETCWLSNLLRELHTTLSSATLVYCDNVSAVYLSYNPVQHQRTKHIEIDIHFIRDLVVVGQVQVLHVPSRYQFADIFTKCLPSALFEEFRTSLSVRCALASTVGEC
nr:ribonuclease H-like domain-containing protein [Tanacetum cinerariifolium]